MWHSTRVWRTCRQAGHRPRAGGGAQPSLSGGCAGDALWADEARAACGQARCGLHTWAYARVARGPSAAEARAASGGGLFITTYPSPPLSNLTISSMNVISI